MQILHTTMRKLFLFPYSTTVTQQNNSNDSSDDNDGDD